MRDTLAHIATEASKVIMEVYQGSDFDIQEKLDQSPVTQADLKANDVIMKLLDQEFDWPILSEEALVDYDTRKHWSTFWMVDPLDGTRSFISKEDDFTVNIALIQKGQPIAGVLMLPVTGEVFTAQKDEGAFKGSQKIFCNETRPYIEASGSRAHKGNLIQKFFQLNNIEHVSSRGSSLKFGLLAEGLIDVYPRFGPTSEWDTAAGHAIAVEAGCKVLSNETGEELQYNKEDILNPHFIAAREGLSFKLPY